MEWIIDVVWSQAAGDWCSILQYLNKEREIKMFHPGRVTGECLTCVLRWDFLMGPEGRCVLVKCPEMILSL